MPSSAVMAEFSKGRLRSGSKRGPKVKKRAQAVAIMLSERRKEQGRKKRKRSRSR